VPTANTILAKVLAQCSSALVIINKQLLYLLTFVISLPIANLSTVSNRDSGRQNRHKNTMEMAVPKEKHELQKAMTTTKS